MKEAEKCLRHSFSEKVPFDKDMYIQELKVKMSNAFCDIDFALLHLGYFMPKEIKNEWYKKKKAQNGSVSNVEGEE